MAGTFTTAGIRAKILVPNNARGFSLLELLVALSVFAIMTGMAYGGLRSLVKAREHNLRETERLAALDSAMSLLQRDLIQVVNRPVHDQYGDLRPPLEYHQENGPVLEFSRTGRRNPTGQKRSSLLRVTYLLADGCLERHLWPELERKPGDTPFKEEILQQVEVFRITFFAKGRWYADQWPPRQAETEPPRVLPQAVKITVTLKDWGTIHRLFILPG